MEKKPVIATELVKGQGLGNQLFCYVTIRCLAMEKGWDFGIGNSQLLANTIESKKGLYFMDLDCGVLVDKNQFDVVHHEREDRIYLGNSTHDIEHGCYITGVDQTLFHLSESTLIYGNLQAEAYFGKYKEQIKKWMQIKPAYNCMEYSRENLCVINIRGGEYASNPELFLRRKYWLDAMKIMRQKRTDMQFVVVTDDLAAARRILPEVEAHHFDLAGDYTVIKNAYYLILSNSTFAFFPAYTSDTARYIIAPKYWARHNVSDGYWASEQNIYSICSYLDRKGRLFSAQDCIKELEAYKKTSPYYQKIGQKLSGSALLWARGKSMGLVAGDMFVRMLRSCKRRLCAVLHQ